MNSIFRPKYNFTPENNWMNDPNGLVYNEFTKEYHLFFQYCDSLDEDQTKKYWGHAVSEDLMHWKELAPAIAYDSLGGIWSGSAVIDRNNTSGFFDDLTPPGARMVAFFTYAYGDTTYGFQKQGVAYSKDNGLTWIKYDGNPVIKGKEGDTVLYESRDPKVFWYENPDEPDGGIWIMIIAGMWARIFTSHNLRDWEFNGDVFYSDGISHLESECPDLFPMPVDGDKNNIKWVYTGGGRFYVIGDIVKNADGKYQFKEESGKKEPMFGSEALYAAQSYYNDPKGRRIGIYWLIDKTARELEKYNKTWDGFQSIPMEYKLVSEQGDLSIKLYPVEELFKITDPFRRTILENILVNNDILNIYDSGNKTVIDADLIINIKDCDGFTVRLRENKGTSIRLSYKKSEGFLRLDTTSFGIHGNQGVYSMPYVNKRQNIVKLKIILDAGIVYAFADDGAACVNAVTFPESMTSAMSVCAENGTCVIEEFKCSEE